MTVVSLGAEYWSCIPPNSPNPPCPGSTLVTSPSTPVPWLPSVCPPGALLPPSGKKCKIVILFNALCTIFVLKAVMTKKVTGNFGRIYKNRFRIYRSLFFFTILGIISSSGYWRTKGLVEIFTPIWREETVCNNCFVGGCEGLHSACRRDYCFSILYLYRPVEQNGNRRCKPDSETLVCVKCGELIAIWIAGTLKRIIPSSSWFNYLFLVCFQNNQKPEG
jgi:hypothetical protein